MAIEDTGRPVGEYHSRFDEEHYRNCQDCYEDHLDFVQECEDDARLDAMAEREEYGNED
jgi:hypothetical protein